MLNFKIDKVAEVLQLQSDLFNCSLKFAWDNYMHSYITTKFTLNDVLDYIEDIKILKDVEAITKEDNGVRYSFDEVKEVAIKKLNIK